MFCTWLNQSDLGGPPQSVCPLAPSSSPTIARTNTPTTIVNGTTAPSSSSVTMAPSPEPNASDSPSMSPIGPDKTAHPSMPPILYTPTCPPLHKKSKPSDDKEKEHEKGSDSGKSNYKARDEGKGGKGGKGGKKKERERENGSMAKLSNDSKRRNSRRLMTGNKPRPPSPYDCPDESRPSPPPPSSAKSPAPSSKDHTTPVPSIERKSKHNIFKGGKGHSSKGHSVKSSSKSGKGGNGSKMSGSGGSSLKFSKKKEKVKESSTKSKEMEVDDSILIKKKRQPEN